MVYFDLLSFAFMLYAAWSIPADTEITISYVEPIAPAATCQATLGFKGTCAVCADFARSDWQRRELEAIPKLVLDPTTMFPWLHTRGSGMPDDYLTKLSLRALKLIRQEGLEATTIYTMHLWQLCQAYAMLGDHEQYLLMYTHIKETKWVEVRGECRDMTPADPEMHPIRRVCVKGGARLLHDLQVMLKPN